jgi:hypothetical protein
VSWEKLCEIIFKHCVQMNRFLEAFPLDSHEKWRGVAGITALSSPKYLQFVLYLSCLAIELHSMDVPLPKGKKISGSEFMVRENLQVFNILLAKPLVY